MVYIHMSIKFALSMSWTCDAGAAAYIEMLAFSSRFFFVCPIAGNTVGGWAAVLRSSKSTNR
jgi:hypothetical protein